MFVLTYAIGSSCPGEPWNVFFTPLNNIQQNGLIVMLEGRTQVVVGLMSLARLAMLRNPVPPRNS